MDLAKGTFDQNYGGQPDGGAEPFAERFEIMEELGRGGMSVVYEAREVLLERKVAIKVLNRSFANDLASLQRFRNEARACSALTHPNIVQIHSFGVTKDDEQPFIVMELLEGKTLEQELKDQGVFEVQKFADIFLPVLDALVYAHAENILHRDLKPSNLMVLRNSSASRQVKVKVLDFGIAKALENLDLQDTQATVGLLGSPLYMSPEQCAGSKLDARTDIYSLACVMYESIVGKPPFIGDTPLETMYEHLKMSVPKLVEVSGSLNIPKALFDVIIEALAKEPARRPQHMAEFRDNVADALTKTDMMRRRAANFIFNRHAFLYVLIAVSLTVVAILFSFQLRSMNKSTWVRRPAQEILGRVDDMVYIERAEELRSHGNYQAALQKGLMALKVASRVSKDHPVWLCDAHKELASIYIALAEPAKVEKEYLAAISVFSNPTSASRISSVTLYGRWLLEHKRGGEALQLLRKELCDCEQYLSGEADRDVAGEYWSFADLLNDSGKYQDAAMMAKKGLSHFDRLPYKRCDQTAVGLTFSFYKASLKLGKANEGLAEVKKTSARLQQVGTMPDEKAYFDFARLADQYPALRAESLALYKLCLKNGHATSISRGRTIMKEAEAAIARLEKTD